MHKLHSEPVYLWLVTLCLSHLAGRGGHAIGLTGLADGQAAVDIGNASGSGGNQGLQSSLLPPGLEWYAREWQRMYLKSLTKRMYQRIISIQLPSHYKCKSCILCTTCNPCKHLDQSCIKHCINGIYPWVFLLCLFYWGGGEGWILFLTYKKSVNHLKLSCWQSGYYLQPIVVFLSCYGMQDRRKFSVITWQVCMNKLDSKWNLSGINLRRFIHFMTRTLSNWYLVTLPPVWSNFVQSINQSMQSMQSLNQSINQSVSQWQISQCTQLQSRLRQHCNQSYSVS